MIYDDMESADCTSDDHEVWFREYLSTMDFFVVCKKKQANVAVKRVTCQIGPWSVTDCTCLLCDEVFGIINPDPVN